MEGMRQGNCSRCGGALTYLFKIGQQLPMTPVHLDPARCLIRLAEGAQREPGRMEEVVYDVRELPDPATWVSCGIVHTIRVPVWD